MANVDVIADRDSPGLVGRVGIVITGAVLALAVAKLITG
jgi:hypothetical protein